MSTFLITGVAGFIGSSLARSLLAQGHLVRGIDDLSNGKRANIADLEPVLDFREQSVLNPAALADACGGVDYVLHEAGLSSVPGSIANPKLADSINVEGTLNLLVAARDAGVKRVVYASSASIYGEANKPPLREEMLADPRSPYAVQKLTGEHYMRVFYAAYGLETLSLRYFNVFGPRQDPSSQYSSALAIFISQMLRGETVNIFGDGEQSRDFVYIDDVISANLLACTAPAETACGKVFNIASGKRCPLNQMFRLLQQIIGDHRLPTHSAARAGDLRHSLADISLAKRDLGYAPLVEFEEGLARTVQWYRSALGHTTASMAARKGEKE